MSLVAIKKIEKPTKTVTHKSKYGGILFYDYKFLQISRYADLISKENKIFLQIIILYINK